MASLLDLYSPGAGSNALGNSFAGSLPGMLPSYRLDSQPQFAMEDTATGMSRLGRGFDRSLFQLNNSGAGKGQWGSSGLGMRGDWLNQDTQDKGFDLQTQLARNLADVARQRATTFMGLY